jgi:hypothetical protein
MRPARHKRESREHNSEELDKSQSHRLGTPLAPYHFAWVLSPDLARDTGDPVKRISEARPDKLRPR